MEIIRFTTSTGLSLWGNVIDQFPKGKLVYCQERLVIVDNSHKEIEEIDLINLTQQLK